ncbi:hypothetical protein ACI6QG_17310 [Roseococcus sp. DSY-14]|uniref:hypothetical protein n=1 Tax=Roseococcus sp. DSY-14 TaxID=3369650 RepID=UPI00387A844D
MSANLPHCLLQRSEAGPAPVIWGGDILPQHERAIAYLLASGLLVERAPATSWPVCDRCDGACGEREVLEVDGALVAECPNFPDRTRRLLPHEVRSFAIAIRVLVEELARASGLTGGTEEIARGTWNLGATAGGRAVMLVLDDTILASPDAIALLGRFATLASATVLVPDATAPAASRRLRDAGCHVVRTAVALEAAVLKLDADRLIPSVAVEARLVIQVQAKTAMLDGRRLNLTDQPFALLLALARAAGQHAGFVPLRDLEAAVYGNALQPESRPVRDVVRVLKDRMAQSQPAETAAAVRDLIANRPPASYRLVLTASEIAISP